MRTTVLLVIGLVGCAKRVLPPEEPKADEETVINRQKEAAGCGMLEVLYRPATGPFCGSLPMSLKGADGCKDDEIRVIPRGGAPACWRFPRQLSGVEQLHLPEPVKKVMYKREERELDLAVDVCISSEGTTTSVAIIAPSWAVDSESWQAFYDEAIRTWRYRPLTIDGVATGFCKTLFLHYRLGF